MAERRLYTQRHHVKIKKGLIPNSNSQYLSIYTYVVCVCKSKRIGGRRGVGVGGSEEWQPWKLLGNPSNISPPPPPPCHDQCMKLVSDKCMSHCIFLKIRSVRNWSAVYWWKSQKLQAKVPNGKLLNGGVLCFISLHVESFYTDPSLLPPTLSPHKHPPPHPLSTLTHTHTHINVHVHSFLMQVC